MNLRLGRADAVARKSCVAPLWVVVEKGYRGAKTRLREQDFDLGPKD